MEQHSTDRAPGVPLSPAKFFCITGLGLTILLVARLVYFNALFLPPGDFDEIFFDVISVNLAAGNGFNGSISAAVSSAYHGLDPSLLGSTAWAADLGVNSITTFRPPLYPALVAVLYCIFGPSFAAFRILNCFFLAFGGAAVLTQLRRIVPAAYGIIVFGLLQIDQHLFAFTRIGLSESLGFMLAAFLMSVPSVSAPGSKARVMSLGVLFGLMILARPVFLFWLPVGALLAFEKSLANESFASRLKRVAGMCLIAGIIYSPWAVRSCLLLKGLRPLGSQGDIVMGEVYFQRGESKDWDGNWSVERAVAFHRSIRTEKTGLERERAVADIGRQIGREWFFAHYDQLPRLWLSRIQSLWWVDAMPYQRGLALAFFLSIVPALRIFRPLRALCLIAVCHTAAIAFAYNAKVEDELYGRFLCSLYPLFFFTIALAAYSLTARLRSGDTTISAGLSPSST